MAAFQTEFDLKFIILSCKNEKVCLGFRRFLPILCSSGSFWGSRLDWI